MKNRIIISSLTIIIGLLLILVPYYILPVCHPPVGFPAVPPMKCFWTARAELGIGVMVIVLGGLLLACRSHLIRLGLSMALACIALLSAAIPTFLIGMCRSEMMSCHIGTLPALLLLSAFLLIISLINVLYLNRVTAKN